MDNLKLAQALLEMVIQDCYPYWDEPDKDVVAARGVTAHAIAIDVLFDEGYLEDIGGKGRCIHARISEKGKALLAMLCL